MNDYVRNKIIWAGTLFVAVYSLSASAACTPQNTWLGKFFDLSFPATIVVHSDVPVGTVVYVNNIAFASESWIRCDRASSMGSDYLNGWRPDTTGLTPTNVRGIAVRISKYHPNGTATAIPLYGPTISGNITQAWTTDGFRVELIKTGPVTGGVLATGVYAGIGMVGLYRVASLRVTGGGNIVAAACSVTNTSIPVNMGTPNLSAFTGPGTPVNERSFSIPLNCDADAKINLEIEAIADSSGRAGVIALDPSSSGTAATGIGIQLLHNSVPVTLNSPIAIGTAPTGGAYFIPLVARYLQTQGTATAGVANSTATFTMTYN